MVKLLITRCLLVHRPLSDGALLRPRRKDMWIIICDNNPPDRKWGWTTVGVNWVGAWRHTWKRWSWEFEDFEKTGSWGSTVKASGWVFRIWSKQISLGLDRLRWFEILDITNVPCRGMGQHIMVSIGFMICISIFVSPRTEGRKK